MRRVVITGLGTVNALGLDVASSYPRMLAGENGVSTIDRFDTTGIAATIAAQVNWDPVECGFDVKEQRKLDPFTMWALMASDEALRDAGFDDARSLPEEQRMRTVKIWQKAKTAMSSGTAKIHRWHITWGPPKTSLNGLMGWTGGDDPMAAMDMEFDTQEAAIRFAKKMGWKYDLKPEMKDTNASRFGTNNYSHNFLPKSVEHELKQNGTRTKLFENPKAGQSNYFRPLTWQGDRPVDQHGPASPTK